MSDQDVPMNDVQRALCAKYHLDVKPHGDGFIVTDRDPALIAKKKGLPKHRGTDLTALIMLARQAQNARNNVTDETETVSETETVAEPVVVVDAVVETVEPTEEFAEDLIPEDEPEEDEDEPVTNVVSLRRAVLTEDDLTQPPSVLKDVILDDTGKKAPRTSTVKKARKHRDNRLARALRAILENPEMTVAQQAEVAGVTVPMLGYYEIQLRSVWKIIAEKYGDEVIPMLPKLNK